MHAPAHHPRPLLRG